MGRFLSARLSSLAPYTPGEQPEGSIMIKLNTNESPYPPAPGVMEAVTYAEVERLNRYPDPSARVLEEAIAVRYDLRPNQVIAGNGSDEILAFCFQAFCDTQAPPCFADVTYGFYQALTKLYGLTPKILPLDKNFAIVPENYYDAGGTIFLANPNAPTGLYLPLDKIEAILRNNPGNLVVVDEAYVHFGGESAAKLIDSFDNLLVVNTFSKSHNLAGARIGYALGQRGIIDDLRKIKYSFHPYNLSRLSIVAGVAAMGDTAYFKKCTGAIRETRAWTAEALASRGFTVTASETNFVFVKPPKISARAYYEELKDRGILVRHFNGERVCDWVRISIGTAEQMRALVQATDRILEETV